MDYKVDLNYSSIIRKYVNRLANSGYLSEGEVVARSSYEDEEATGVIYPVSSGDVCVGVVYSQSLYNQPAYLTQLGFGNILVNNSAGNIVKGDKLIAQGGNSGACIKYTSPERYNVVGIALESYSGSENATIEADITSAFGSMFQDMLEMRIKLPISEPTIFANGDTYINTIDNKFYYYSNGWKALSGM